MLEFLKGEKTLNNIFDALDDEHFHEKLWRALTYHEFEDVPMNIIDKIIKYGLSKRTSYSYTGDYFYDNLRNKVPGYFLALFRYLIRYLNSSKYEKLMNSLLRLRSLALMELLILFPKRVKAY